MSRHVYRIRRPIGIHRRPFCCARAIASNGRVRKRTLCNLSDWPTAHIEGLRGVLKGGTVIAAERDAFTVTRTLPHGHVAAALGTARKIGLDRLLDPDGDRCRDLVLALLVSRILDPASKLATARALSPATATSSLSEMLHLGGGRRRRALHRAGLAAGAPAHHRDRFGQAPSQQRHAGAVRCVVKLHGGALLSACQARLQQRWQEGYAADHLRSALRA